MQKIEKTAELEADTAQNNQLHVADISEEQLEKISKFTRRSMKVEELYIFSVILCDNQIDRDGERFSVKCLRELVDLYVGVTGIFDHDPKGANQTARIFETALVEDNSKTSTVDESYTALKAFVYMVRSNSTNDLILEIDAGIKKEVSVGCAVKNSLCSVCGEAVGSEKCKHKKGKLYGQSKIPCHTVHTGGADAYEWSFVAVPAQMAAGVVKNHSQSAFCECDEIVQALKSGVGSEKAIASLKELKDLAKLGEEYVQQTCREHVRLCHLALPALSSQAALTMARNMPFEELLECNRALKKTVELLPKMQLSQGVAGAVSPQSNNMFKL